MTIEIPSVPSSVRRPGAYIALNTRNAISGLPGNIQKLLLCGNGTPGVGILPGVIKQLFSSDDAATYWGRGSVLHLMALAAMRTGSPCQIFGVSDDGLGGSSGSGSESSGSGGGGETREVQLTCSEGSTLDTIPGTLTLRIGAKTYSVGYGATTTGADIVAALVAMITADPDCPFTISSERGTITLTAKGPARAYNDIVVSEEHDAAGSDHAGFTFTSTDTGSDPATGLDLDVEYILTKIAAGKWSKVAFSKSTAEIAESGVADILLWLDTVSGPLEQRPSIAVIAADGNQSGLSDATGIAGGANHARLVVPWCKGMQTPGFLVGAAVAAVLCNRENPNRSFDGEPVPGLDAPEISDRLLGSEQDTLLLGGVTPLVAGPGETVQIVRAVTTHTLDENSNPDESLVDVTTITSLDYTREAIRLMQLAKYNQANITDDLLIAIKGDVVAVLKDLEDLEIVERVDDNKDAIKVERSTTPGRVNVSIPTDIVQGLHVLAEVINLQIALN